MSWNIAANSAFDFQDQVSAAKKFNQYPAAIKLLDTLTSLAFDFESGTPLEKAPLFGANGHIDEHQGYCNVTFSYVAKPVS